MSDDPLVIWITGLSGAGKTTVGRRVYARLKAQQPNVVFLDGDSFREVLGNDLGHDEGDRVLNARRLSRLCAFLSAQGIKVVCSTMSLYSEIWEWNRENLRGYFEVYLKVDRDVLMARDPKGLYQRAQQGRESNIVGCDLAFHEPPRADLVLVNNASSSRAVEAAAEQIIRAVSARCLP